MRVRTSLVLALVAVFVAGCVVVPGSQYPEQHQTPAYGGERALLPPPPVGLPPPFREPRPNQPSPAYVWLDGMSTYSSRAQHLGHYSQSFLREHAQYWQLGNTPFERQTQYAQLLEQGISVAVQNALTHTVQTGWMLGDERFIAQVELETGRRVRPAARGRPRKQNV